jgi:hypothetical protein
MNNSKCYICFSFTNVKKKRYDGVCSIYKCRDEESHEHNLCETCYRTQSNIIKISNTNYINNKTNKNNKKK